PRVRSDDAVDRKAATPLERPHRCVRRGPEDPVDRHVLAVGAEQMLKRPNRMLSVTLANQRPWLDGGSHAMDDRTAKSWCQPGRSGEPAVRWSDPFEGRWTYRSRIDFMNRCSTHCATGARGQGSGRTRLAVQPWPPPPSAA